MPSPGTSGETSPRIRRKDDAQHFRREVQERTHGKIPFMLEIIIGGFGHEPWESLSCEQNFWFDDVPTVAAGCTLVQVKTLQLSPYFAPWLRTCGRSPIAEERFSGASSGHARMLLIMTLNDHE